MQKNRSVLDGVEQSGRPFPLQQNRLQSKPQLILLWGIPVNLPRRPAPNRNRAGLFLLVAALTVQSSFAQTLPLLEVAKPRLLMRQERTAYRNFAYDNWVNYPNHASPYEDAPKAIYGSMGNYLLTGYPAYEWLETRRPDQKWGSSIFKDVPLQALSGSDWVTIFDSMLVGKDGYGNWGYSLIVGDALLARLTPLTLSKANFNGFRMDIATPYLQLTGMASRFERPHSFQEVVTPWMVDDYFHMADDSTLMLAGRAQGQLGGLQLGLNWVNQHLYQSTKPGNSLKGILRPGQALIDQVLVRISDDSPLDGSGGAVVQDIQIRVNGELRPDLKRPPILHTSGVQIQVGRISQETGSFSPISYNTPSPSLDVEGLVFYREREIPLYADYLYRLDHEAGIDVSKQTNLKGLVSSFRIHPGGVARVDGNEQLVYLFDLTQEGSPQSVELEAMLANDYKVEVALLSNRSPRARGLHAQYISSFYRTVARAKGNVRDETNIRQLRIPIDENTRQFVYSADFALQTLGLEIKGEFARSALHSRFPAHLDREPTFADGAHSVDRGNAYFINATRWFGCARLGAEYFSINPEFQTEFRTFFDPTFEIEVTNLYGLANRTLYWQLVDDNEDGDAYPDRRIGNLPGLINDSKAYDIDGVFPGQDEDRDGAARTNRNLNTVPDYEEPFLMFDIEPNEYIYGLDRNNNDEPDFREDDGAVDYPYDYDQHGYHLFGQFDLTRRWKLAVGQHRVDEVAGGGRNHSSYAILTFRREGVAMIRRIFLENHLRRVRDDISDEYVVVDEIPIRQGQFGQLGLTFYYEKHDGSLPPPRFVQRFRRDPVWYADSYVNESYAEARVRPVPSRAHPNAARAFQLAAGGASLQWAVSAQPPARLLVVGGERRLRTSLGPSDHSTPVQVHVAPPRRSGTEPEFQFGDSFNSHTAFLHAGGEPHRASGWRPGIRTFALPSRRSHRQTEQLRAAHLLRHLDQPQRLFRLRAGDHLRSRQGRKEAKRRIPGSPRLPRPDPVCKGDHRFHRIRPPDIVSCSKVCPAFYKPASNTGR